MWVDVFPEAIWRWSLKPTSYLLLNTGSSLPEPGMLLLSFAKRASPPSGPFRARMSLLSCHAGVGVVSRYGAPLSLPTMITPSFAEYFSSGRARRVVLPLGTGDVATLFAIYGYPGAENDPDKLALMDQLLTSVLAEAMMLVGDLNADPLVIPFTCQRYRQMGPRIDVELAFASGCGVSAAPTCQFRLDEVKGTREDVALACPIAPADATACLVFPER